jgi:hypothetical protein
MNDEVSRLRHLRKVALRARGLAEVLRDSERRDSIFAKSALLCWRLARIATGRLRAHPYPEYQRGPIWRDTLNDGFSVIVSGLVARKQKRAMRVYLQELRQVSRELDDVRSLTLSPDLSDSLGRAQAHMRQLLEQLEMRVRIERGAKSEVAIEATPHIEVEVSADRPYLAL